MRLHVREWGSGDRVALLLHGMVGSSGSWWQVGPALVQRGYRVIAVDLPGHGQSAPAPQATVELFVDSLLESVPAKPKLAIGHSMGAVILAAAAERLGPARAVYVDTPFAAGPHGGDFDRAEATRIHTSRKAERTLDYLRQHRQGRSEEDRVVEAEAARQWDVPTAVSLMASGTGQHFTPPLSIPSLMVHADPSDYVTPEHAEELRATGYTVRSVPGAGHSVWYGRIDDFMSALEGWA